ncbi:MAG: excinuclease ABC subunit UvrC [Ignavibacteria bacterium]|jgi:excinuclease ABC subunit C|nr:excinuclease ABC subunit UvrC [Ignavibacteria bacterium]MDH7528196.1 excinuclease ABC subunit UvrC [Ignavibacteria bacterium]
MNSSELQKKIENLPKLPGVYLFKNKNDKIIYIGKAKSLYNRVKSYFAPNINSVKTEALVSKIFDIDVIVTDNEVEALILEANLIKQYKPRYNVNLKDDKSYPYIVITNEDFPQVYPTRRVVMDGSKYFGPYTEVKVMKHALKVLRDIFKIRSCKYNLTEETIQKGKYKVCLDYHIKKCDGPCEGLISKEEYNKMISEVELVLKGNIDGLINSLTEEMNKLSSELKFEKAAEIRNKLESLKVYANTQKVVSQELTDRDIITFAADVPDGVAAIFNIRKGKLVGRKKFTFNYNLDLPDSVVLSDLIRNIYSNPVEIPDQIIVSDLPDEKEIIENWLKEKSGKKVKILTPKSDEDLNSLLNLCKQNAVYDLNEIKLQRMKKEGSIPYVLKSLQRDLYLSKPPIRIECFDISTLQGADTVASLVVFENGKPKKSDYRKFIIKSVKGPDDFASMAEVIERHYKRVLEENKPLPDLIMVDGGKGQLNAALKVLKKLGISNINIIGLAKRLEEIFMPDKKESIQIPKTSSSLKLLQQIRDEAHRFAITFHREKREKRIIRTELENISGIGPKTIQTLLTKFGSVEQIKQLSLDKLTETIGKSKAQIVYNYFHKSFDGKTTTEDK